MASVFEIRHWPGVARAGWSGPLIINVFSGTATVAALDELERSLTSHMAVAQGPFLGLTVLQTLNKPADSAVLERSKRLSEHLDPKLRATAVVLATGGLTAVFG